MTFIATDGTAFDTEDARFWYEAHRGIAPPPRTMPADTIVENGIAFVTENKEHWIVNFYDSRKPTRPHSKESEPYYPLALYAKWGYRAVDLERIKALDRQCCEEYKNRVGGEVDDDDEQPAAEG